CGHTDCGAMKGAMSPESVRHLHHVHNWLANAQAAAAKVKARHAGEDVTHEQLLELIQENVVQQLKHLETHPSVAAAQATDRVLLHGWVYDIEHGRIYCYESGTRQWVPVREHYAHVLELAASHGKSAA
ncbi:MAG: carbonic anhydrase, partial [Gammaproteobacteria bacterium]